MNRRRWMQAHMLPLPPVVSPDAAGVLVDPMRPGLKTTWGECEATRSIAAKILGRKGGLKGGHARAAKLTPEQRSAIAKKGAKARWKKQRAKSKPAKPASTA